jgi:hypothetical protein
MYRPLLNIAVVCAIAAALGAGCKRVPPPGGASGSRPEQARHRAEELAVSAVLGAATSQASVVTVPTGTTVPAVIASNPPRASSVGPRVGPQSFTPVMEKGVAHPKSPPRPGSPAIIKERIVGVVPFPTEAEAEEDLLNSACDVIERRLAELDPPVKYRPSPNEVKNEFARRDTRTFRQPDAAQREEYARNGVGANLVYAECDIEVTAEQIRDLRTRDRVANTLRILVGVAVMSLACFLFLRADEWTKGYMTRWLACGAVALGGGAAAALYFV